MPCPSDNCRACCTTYTVVVGGPTCIAATYTLTKQTSCYWTGSSGTVHVDISCYNNGTADVWHLEVHDATGACNGCIYIWETNTNGAQASCPPTGSSGGVWNWVGTNADTSCRTSPSPTISVTRSNCPAEPEIYVAYGSYQVPDGQTVASATNGTTFGTVCQGASSVSRTYTIYNNGNATLTLSSPSLPTGFSSTSLPASIAAGSSASWTVTMTTGSAINANSDVSFTTNDPDENPYNFRVTGTVTGYPTNDSFANATTISGCSVSVSGDNTCATSEVGEQANGANGPNKTIWWKWTAPASRNVTVDTLGSAINTMLGVYTGSAVNSLTSIGKNDDYAGYGSASRVDFSANSGTTYYISVDGYNGATGGISVNLATAGPSNDNFASAISLGSTSSTTVYGSNVCAGVESGEQVHYGSGGPYHSVWWTWTAPGNGTVTITTVGSTFDTLLALYTGSAVNSLTKLTSNDDYSGQPNNTSRIDYAVTSGTLYRIAVDGYSGAEGDIQLNLTFAASAPEILISGNAIEVVSGDNTPSATDDTDFGTLTQNSGTHVHTFTINNTGSATLTISSITISGDASFTVSSPTSSSIAAGGNATFTVTANTATTAGTKQATVTVNNNDSNEGTYTFVVQQTVAAPEIRVVGNGTSITTGDITPAVADDTDFGSLVQGTGTHTHTFTIYNDGTSNLTISSITISGDASLTVSGPVSSTVAASGSTTFTVSASTATTGGLKQATVTINNNDYDEGTFTFRVQQTVLAPEIRIVGNGVEIVSGDVTPSATDDTDFGTLVRSGATHTHTFTVYNDGNATLNISAISVTGSAEFSCTEPSSFALSGGTSTTFTITANPAYDGGTKTATLSLSSNDWNEGTYTFQVKVVVQASEITVTGNASNIADGSTTTSLTNHTDFGSMNQGAAGVTRTYTVTNNGDTNLTLGTVSVTSNFTCTQPLSTTIAPAGSTTFTVTATTGTIGSFTGAVSFTTNDYDENPFNFNVSSLIQSSEIRVVGNGVEIVSGDITPNVADWTDWSSQTQGNTNVGRQFYIYNDGNVNLTISSLTISGDASFSVSAPGTTTIAAGGNTTFTVTASQATTVGTKQATVTINNNDYNEGTYTFRVQQTILAPEIAVTGNGNDIADGSVSTSATNHTDFGTMAQGAAGVTRTYTITNSGNSTLTLGTVSVTSNFTCTQPLSTSLAGAGSTTFTVTATTGSIGSFTGAVSFSTNDWDENPFNFNVSSTIIPAFRQQQTFFMQFF